MADSEEGVTFLVIDSKFGPVAAGYKSVCLLYIVGKLSEQSESQTLANPSSFELRKIKRLGHPASFADESVPRTG
jgi:hypothetical protein